MHPWLLALLLKPFIGIATIAVLFYGSRLVACCIHLITPDCKAKSYLFCGWRGDTARNPSGLAD